MPNNSIYFKFLENKYTTTYFQIINKAQSENRRKLKRTSTKYIYYEIHHIIPKSLGGNNSPENLVNLTAREHFIVHALLYRMTTGKEQYSMGYAWRMMKTTNNRTRRYFNSKLYESTRIDLRHTEEAKKKMSIQRKGKRGHPQTEDTKKKISETMSNIVHGEEWNRKISEAKTGSTLSDTHRKNISEGNKGKKRKLVECPHCKKVGGINNMKRYHFSNCKVKEKE